MALVLGMYPSNWMKIHFLLLLKERWHFVSSFLLDFVYCVDGSCTEINSLKLKKLNEQGRGHKLCLANWMPVVPGSRADICGISMVKPLELWTCPLSECCSKMKDEHIWYPNGVADWMIGMSCIQVVHKT